MDWKLRLDPSGFQIRWSDRTAAHYQTQGFWRNETLVTLAATETEKQPNKVLLIEGDKQWTRADIWNRALTLAGYFDSVGLTSGDVISFQLPNWGETAIIALAARMKGLVINPIPVIYRSAELRYILQDCRSKLIFIPRMYRKHDHLDMINQLRPQCTELMHVIVVRDGNDDTNNSTKKNSTKKEPIKWERCMTEADPLDPTGLWAVDAAAVMMVMYTSGTTGRPKGVLHTHYTYDYRVRAMAEAWSINANDVIFMPSPVTHITGAFWVFDMPWVCGGTSVLLDTWTAEEGIRFINTHGCTVSGGATPFLQQLLDYSTPENSNLSSLRLFFCGGTTVSPELILRASRSYPNCLFFRAYGSTEMTTTTLGIRHPDQAKLGATTDGEVVYPTEVNIVHPENGAEIEPGQIGEIIARGPEQFVGYLHPEDNLDLFTEDGFFHTGDLGRWQQGNFLIISGRKKDIIIRSGENISPKEVEDVLYRHPAIAEVAIVAMPSAQTGEKACAFVILRPGQCLNLEEIQRFLVSEGMARQKIPEHIELVAELPRVPSGKIRKDVLRKRAHQIAEVI